MVISKHPIGKRVTDFHGIPFHQLTNPKDKQASEQEMLELLGQNVDLIVLARYMQILGPDFVAQYLLHMINIHHSFLPAFIGAKPYHQAFERGVKLIGATSHYVTANLDEGPIIEQDVVRISHRHGRGHGTKRAGPREGCTVPCRPMASRKPHPGLPK